MPYPARRHRLQRLLALGVAVALAGPLHAAPTPREARAAATPPADDSLAATLPEPAAWAIGGLAMTLAIGRLRRRRASVAA